METLKTITSRHSVRTYTGEPLPEACLEKILLAANAAPVGMGRYDQMHLTVVSNKEFLKETDKAAAAFMHREGAHPTYGAPTLIFISGKDAASAAMVAHSMALAATDLGIGVCYLWGVTATVSNTPELLAKLSLPEGHELLAAVGVGPTNETYTERDIPKDRIATTYVK